MRGIYLCACKARHPKYNIIYQDIDEKWKCDLGGDALEVDLSPYDFIIATPPCNWWSKANPYYKTSKYSLLTKHLLPDLLLKLGNQDKPYIIENVKNLKRFKENGIFDICKDVGAYIYIVGRHIYFSNINTNLLCIQHQDFKFGGKRVNKDGYNQGGSNVHTVIEIWLRAIQNTKISKNTIGNKKKLF